MMTSKKIHPNNWKRNALRRRKRETITTTGTTGLTPKEIADTAKEARQGRGIKTFKDSRSFLEHLWSR